MKINNYITDMLHMTHPSDMQSKHYCGIIVNKRLVSCHTNAVGIHAECAGLRYLQRYILRDEKGKDR